MNFHEWDSFKKLLFKDFSSRHSKYIVLPKIRKPYFINKQRLTLGVIEYATEKYKNQPVVETASSVSD